MLGASQARRGGAPRSQAPDPADSSAQTFSEKWYEEIHSSYTSSSANFAKARQAKLDKLKAKKEENVSSYKVDVPEEEDYTYDPNGNQISYNNKEEKYEILIALLDDICGLFGRD